MSENGTIQGGNAPQSDTSLMENGYVKELFNILQNNSRDTTGLSAIIGHVNEMESFVKRAEDKIADMKSQLDSMKEIQNHPFKTYLQNTIKTLENKVAEVKERLAELKANIIDGCKNAVSAFKEKGISALANIADFFKIKQNLQDWKKDINSMIKADDKAVAKIATFSNEYHSAGRALKNMARVAIGKEPIDRKKEAGKLAAVIAAPYKAQKSVLIGLKKSLDKAITKLDKLENSETVKQAERSIERKPSLLGRLEANKAKVEQIKRDMPMPERAKVQGAEI